MELRILASGSKGNSLFVGAGGIRLLIDAGLTAKDLTARLKEAEIAPESLDAILVTHDHDDHCRGIEVFSRRHPLRLFANEGTAQGVDLRFPGKHLQWEIFETSSNFMIGNLLVEPFTVSHDASDPVGFVLDDGLTRLCLATDLGQATSLVRSKLAGCHVAIIESNHDYQMLMQSQRPWTLKTRIAGRSGHLSNVDAAELVGSALAPQMHTLLLAHLSEDCNTPELALRTMRRTLDGVGRTDVRVEALEQSCISKRYVF